MSSGLTERGQFLVTLWLTSERFALRADHSLGAVHGIAYVEFMVLYQLAAARSEGMRRIDLARAVGRSASGVTRLLRPMEKIGLVRRGHSERDARVSLVELTDAGRLKLDESLLTLNRLGDQYTRHINDEQLQSGIASMDTLNE